MSSKKEPGWVTPIMFILLGGLAFYALSSANSTHLGSSDLPSATSSDATLAYADDTNFDEAVLEADGPVLVDFYADWCGPCKQLAPVLERISEDLTEGRIVKVNVDHSKRLASRYNVRSIPTLLVFVDGQLVDRAVGFQNERELRSLLQQ